MALMSGKIHMIGRHKIFIRTSSAATAGLSDVVIGGNSSTVAFIAAASPV
jgi:hypothetical protein